MGITNAYKRKCLWNMEKGEKEDGAWMTDGRKMVKKI